MAATPPGASSARGRAAESARRGSAATSYARAASAVGGARTTLSAGPGIAPRCSAGGRIVRGSAAASDSEKAEEEGIDMCTRHGSVSSQPSCPWQLPEMFRASSNDAGTLGTSCAPLFGNYGRTPDTSMREKVRSRYPTSASRRRPSPVSCASTTSATLRPSAMAQTTRLCPRD